jgi:hypothetical protein
MAVVSQAHIRVGILDLLCYSCFYVGSPLYDEGVLILVFLHVYQFRYTFHGVTVHYSESCRDRQRK